MGKDKSLLASLLSLRILSPLFFLVLLHPTVFAQQVARQVPHGYLTNFWAYTPPSYSSTGPGHPLLISLHGGSGIVDNNDMNVIVGTTYPIDAAHETPGRLISLNKWDTSLRFIVVSPHLKRDPSIANVNEQNWPPDMVDEVVEYVKTQYNVDVNRIYVTGISVGGAGAWNYAITYPSKVAALMPLGGKAAKGDACAIKDIPIWAFHGQDDPLVPSRFSTDMIQAIQDCNPAIYYPQLNLNNSMGHEIWNPLYSGKAGYEIYDWLLSFTKGDHANKAPFVFTGVNRKIKARTGPIYLTAEYFDSDGTIANVQWTQVSGPPSLTLEDTNSKFLKIVNPQAGTFTFRLTVTDNDGATKFDEVNITIQAVADSREVTSLTLYKQAASTASPVSDGLTVIGTVTDEMVIDIKDISTGRINILATATTGSNRVRWSINSDQHTRDNSSPFYIKAITSNALSTGWGVFKGTYLVCATPYANSNFDFEGTSLCHKIILSDEVGITKYYDVGVDISLLSSWNTKADGTGSSPLDFSSANRYFVVNNAGRVLSNSSLAIGTDSRLIVSTTGKLTITNALSGPFYIEGTGQVTVSGTGTVGTFTSVSRTSHVIYDGANMTLPAGVTFGHLTLQGTGIKTLAAGTTVVRGNLLIGPNTELRNSGINSNTDVRASGNVTIGKASTVPYVLRFVDGYGNQYLTLPGSHAFRNMSVEGGCTASVVAPAGSIITIGSGTGGGQLDIHTYSLLKLNGADLTLINNAALNVPSGSGTARTGKIELKESVINVNAPTTTGTSLNLFPASGKNHIRALNVNIPAAHPGFQILDSLSVTDSVSVKGGRIYSNGHLSLLSTPLSTAFVGKSTGQILGDVNIERVIKPGKMYRYLAFPVTGFTVAKLQQFIPVSGAFEGRSPGYSTSPSLYEHVEPEGWVPYPRANSTNADPLLTGHGYAVYVREQLFNKKVVMRGGVHNGDFDFSAFLTPNSNPSDPSVGWTLCGNPYPSPIRWSTSNGTWELTDVDPFIYVRDNAYADGQGRFLTSNGAIGDAEFEGRIATGQSFWVRSLSSSPQLKVTQNAKLRSLNPELFRTNGSEVVSLKISMRQNDLEDNTYIAFNERGSRSFQPGVDGVKKKNGYFNISVLSSDTINVAVKTLCDTLCSQEIGLAVEPKKPGTYSLTAEGNAFDHIVHRFYIVDGFENTITEQQEGDSYVFQVTTDPASYSLHRFGLVLEKATVEMPVVTFHEGQLVSSIEGVQWMLNGTDIDGAIESVYVPAAEGDYSVRTTGKNCSRTSAKYAFRITGVDEHNSAVTLYPNPASSFVKLTGLKPSHNSSRYNVASLSGASVQGGSLEVDERGEAEIRLRFQAPGFYILHVADGTRLYQFKFCVK